MSNPTQSCEVRRQPEDSSREEIVRELAFHVMVQRGISDSDAFAGVVAPL